MYCLCSIDSVMRIDNPQTIADAILQAPGWARVGITAPTPVLREEAARELAHAILQASETPEGIPPDQLQLRW